MAIMHFSAQMISRGAGRSAVAAAAYRAGDRLHDAHTGLDHDFTLRADVRDAVLVTPDDAPAWAQDRQSLWDAVNAAEKRGDAQTAREVEVSLPRELTVEQQRALVVGYVQRTFAAQGMVADIGIHAGHNPDVPNPHAHILLTTRPLTPEGFGPKERRWNRKDQLVAWRQGWAAAVNQALAQAGHLERIDARSFQDQGIADRQPTIHEGVAARAMERRGLQAERTQQNRAITAYNATVIDLAAVRAEREALAAALADRRSDSVSAPVPPWLQTLQAAQDDLVAALRDSQVAYWAPVPASQRQAQFDAAFQSQWTSDAGLTYLQTYQAIQPAEAQVRTLQATVTVGNQAAQRLTAYAGWAGRQRKNQAFPHGRHRTEQGYEETFEEWQRKQQALVARGQQAAAQLPQAQQAVATAYQACQDFHVRLSHARAAAWSRLAPALQQADVAADRYHRLVMQATMQGMQQGAQHDGLPWTTAAQERAAVFSRRVADTMLADVQQAAAAAPSPMLSGKISSEQGWVHALGAVLQRLTHDDRQTHRYRGTADTRDLEQAIMNPFLDVTLRVQLQETLNKMKAQEQEAER